jgi:alpha-tubulin suppressor-like RCC1 family protein
MVKLTSLLAIILCLCTIGRIVDTTCIRRGRRLMEYGNNTKTTGSLVVRTLLFFIVSLVMAIMIALVGSNIKTHAASVKQVSTGAETACAVVDGKAKCWGANESGQLGNGTTTNSSTPQAVNVRETAVAEVKECIFGIFCTVKTPYQPASALAGKTVEKVSVGLDHACALASAQVFCWGNNSHGQLGNRSTTSSSLPIAVDVNGSATPKSALAQKEIIDISAGEYFTCALASDGSVACWGEGDNGRLGTNATTDSNYPQAIYSAAGSALAGKKGVKLAKAAGATMCVIAVEGSATTATGSPYCWGWGIDNGTALPANGTTTVPCSKNTPTSKPATSTVTSTTIFESAKPVNVPGATIASMDGLDYVTGHATDGRAYYWGMYGYTETAVISNLTTCVVNPCTSKTQTIMTLALTSSQKKARAANQGGGDKNKNLNSNNSAAQSAYNAANGYTTKTQYGSYQTGGGSYYGIAIPRTVYYAGPSSNSGGNTSCGSQTHYGYTKNATYAYSGQKVVTTPPAWSSTQGGLSAVSGNVFNGLYCATAASTTSCDAHGTSAAEGQTGSNYTPQCTTTGWIFTTTTCTPPPAGPQQVVANGWLAGKAVTSLSTGASGYTCAVANGSVGCWGLNNKGQLGNGSTANKNVPTAVNL